MKFSINKKVFEKYPDLVVYIPVVKGFDNSSRGSDEVSQMVLEAEESVKTRFKNIESVEDDLSVKKYFDAFRAFGVNPKKVKPTHYALIKRIVQGGRLPRINSVVDIYNSISIKYVTPFGGEDLNQLYGDFYLEFAKGGEHWLGISEDKPKGAVKGDLIWRDDYDVSTLSLNWRQCERTKITEDSKNGYFIMDCWENVNDENAFKAAEEFCKSVEKNCGGKYQIYKLDSKNNECEVDFETKKIDGIEVPEKVKIENSDATKTINLSKKQQEETVYNYPQNSLEDRIQLALLEGLYIQKIDIAKNQIPVEKSTSSAKGDLSSTIVLRVAKKYGQNPIELSKIIAGNLSPVEGIAKVEAVAPGFINFFVDGKSVVEVLDKIITQKSDFGRSEKFAGQKWVVEHTSPNPNKSMHLGHMRTNLTGMAVANLIEACGANVIRDCIDNNRGIAIAKLMWGYLKFANKNGFENLTIEDWAEHKDQWYTPQELGKNPGKYMDELYVKGSTDFKEDKEVERVVRDYVVRWEMKIR